MELPTTSAERADGYGPAFASAARLAAAGCAVKKLHWFLPSSGSVPCSLRVSSRIDSMSSSKEEQEEKERSP